MRVVTPKRILCAISAVTVLAPAALLSVAVRADAGPFSPSTVVTHGTNWAMVTFRNRSSTQSVVETMTARVLWNGRPEISYSQKVTDLKTLASTTKSYALEFVDQFGYFTKSTDLGAWLPGEPIKPETVYSFNKTKWVPTCTAEPYLNLTGFRCTLVDQTKAAPVDEFDTDDEAMTFLGMVAVRSPSEFQTRAVLNNDDFHKLHTGPFMVQAKASHSYLHRSCLLCPAQTTDPADEPGEFLTTLNEVPYHVGSEQSSAVIVLDGAVTPFSVTGYPPNGVDVPLGINFTGSNAETGELFWG